MQCPNCGADIRDGFAFCTKCGTQLSLYTQAPTQESADPTPSVSTEPVDGIGTAENVAVPEGAANDPALNAEPQAKKKGGVIAGAIAAVVVIAVVAFAAFLLMRPVTFSVPFNLVLPEYSDSGSQIPVRVTGTTDDGKEVNEIRLLDSPDATLDLAPGTYQLKPGGSPTSSSGDIYRAHDAEYTVVITKDDAFGSNTSATIEDAEDGKVSFSYDYVPAGKATQEDIDSVKQWMEEAGLDATSVEAAIAPIEDAYTIKTEVFEFTIPEYWRGKVEWEVQTDAVDQMIKGDTVLPILVKVYATPGEGNPLSEREELVSIYVTDDTDNSHPGTVDRYSGIGWSTERFGLVTEVAPVCWFAGMDGVTDKGAYLTDLMTEGKGDAPTGLYEAPSSNFELCESFLKEQLGLTVYDTPEANEAAQRIIAEAEERARKAEEARRAQIDADKEAALASNPSVIQSTPTSQNSERADITGTVCHEVIYDQIQKKNVDVYWLELPNELSVVGTQYTGISSKNIILPDTFSSYVGEVVTVNTQFSVRVTASIPQAQVSYIYAVSINSVRDYRY